MSESNNVYENFEDALFRLFMDRVAVVEGERLLRENEELKSDPDAAVPEDIQKRCLTAIKKGIVRRDRKATGKTARRIARVLPLAAIIALLMGLVAYAAFPAFRATVQNLILEKNADYVSWKLADEEVENSIGETIQPNFDIVLPNEYQIIEHEKSAKYEFAAFYSVSNPDKKISIAISYGEIGSFASNAEDVDYYEECAIHGNIALLTIKDEAISITWWEPTTSCLISLNVTGNDIELTKEIAKSIIIKK